MSETYTFASTPTSINEGGSGTFTVNTTNVPNGTSLYWTINHISSASADFTESVGTFDINSNTGSFVITTFADQITEGAQSFTVSIRTNGIAGAVVATSAAITINDTSLTPTYTFATVPASISEGSAGTFIVNTTNVSNGTILYWTLNFTTSLSEDFFSPNGGSFVISSNTGNFEVIILADSLTESTETFSVSIRTGSSTGPVVSTSASINVINVGEAATENTISHNVTVTGLGLYNAQTLPAEFLRRSPSYTTNVDPNLPNYAFLTSNLVIHGNAKISVDDISQFPIPSSISANTTVYANTFLSNGQPINSTLLIPVSSTQGLTAGDRIVTANITSQANTTVDKIYANGNILVQNLAANTEIVIETGEICYFYPRNFSYRNVRTVRSDTLLGNTLLLNLESIDNIRIGSLVSTANIVTSVSNDLITTVRKLFPTNNSILVQNIDANLTVSVGEYVNFSSRPAVGAVRIKGEVIWYERVWTANNTLTNLTRNVGGTVNSTINGNVWAGNLVSILGIQYT